MKNLNPQQKTRLAVGIVFSLLIGLTLYAFLRPDPKMEVQYIVIHDGLPMSTEYFPVNHALIKECADENNLLEKIAEHQKQFPNDLQKRKSLWKSWDYAFKKYSRNFSDSRLFELQKLIKQKGKVVSLPQADTLNMFLEWTPKSLSLLPLCRNESIDTNSCNYDSPDSVLAYANRNARLLVFYDNDKYCSLNRLLFLYHEAYHILIKREKKKDPYGYDFLEHGEISDMQCALLRELGGKTFTDLIDSVIAKNMFYKPEKIIRCVNGIISIDSFETLTDVSWMISDATADVSDYIHEIKYQKIYQEDTLFLDIPGIEKPSFIFGDSLCLRNLEDTLFLGDYNYKVSDSVFAKTNKFPWNWTDDAFWEEMKCAFGIENENLTSLDIDYMQREFTWFTIFRFLDTHCKDDPNLLRLKAKVYDDF